MQRPFICGFCSNYPHCFHNWTVVFVYNCIKRANKDPALFMLAPYCCICLYLLQVLFSSKIRLHYNGTITGVSIAIMWKYISVLRGKHMNKSVRCLSTLASVKCIAVLLLCSWLLWRELRLSLSSLSSHIYSETFYNDSSARPRPGCVHSHLSVDLFSTWRMLWSKQYVRNPACRLLQTVS